MKINCGEDKSGWEGEGKSGSVRNYRGVTEQKTVPPHLQLQVNDCVANGLTALAKGQNIFHTQKPDMFQSQPLLLLIKADSEKCLGT